MQTASIILEVTISLKSLFLKIRHFKNESVLSQVAISIPHSSDNELLPRLSSVTDELFSIDCSRSSSQSLESSQLDSSISNGFWSFTQENVLTSWEKYFLLQARISFKLSAL